jgi:hypothetical protein
MSAPISTNMRGATVQNILGQAAQLSKSAASYATNSVSSVSSSFTPENGSYVLSVLFYLFLFTLVIFLILLLVHFTFYPIFRFTSRDKGFIGVPASTDDKVYWTEGPPPPESRAPLESDELAMVEFENGFSFSLDIYCTKITSTNTKSRIILFKTYSYGIGQTGDFPPGLLSSESIDQICAARPGQSGSTDGNSSSSLSTQSPLSTPPSSTESLEAYMKSKCSMFMYLTDTNDLIVTFFTGPNGVPYSCRPIRNIPLYTPFRVTCVVDKKSFTTYLNGKQTFQKLAPIALNSFQGLRTFKQRFYSAPSWSSNPTQTIFVQNLHIWPRSISYTEVTHANPALASPESFKAPADDSSSGQCFS